MLSQAEEISELGGGFLVLPKTGMYPAECVGGTSMPMYQCCFLNATGSPVRTQALGSSDDRDARREAMALLVRTGRFSGFELWSGDLRIEIYQPSGAKASSETLPIG